LGIPGGHHGKSNETGKPRPQAGPRPRDVACDLFQDDFEIPKTSRFWLDGAR
jgi:hypothetical protein